MTRRPLPRRVGPALGLLAIDVALAVALGWPAWTDPGVITMGGRQDTPYTLWAMAWVARAVGRGHNPWFTAHLSAPGGVNLLTNATATGLGLLLVPVTTRWGPLVAFNVAATGALALTAWSAQLVVRRALGVAWPAAGAAGLVAGFGPTALAQAGGAHLHVTAAFLVPPLLLGVGRLATGTAASPWRWGVGIGTLAGGQLLVGEEVLALAGFAALFGLLGVARHVRWREVARGGVVAAVVFGALVAWPLWLQFRGRGHVVGPIQIGAHYANDLTGFVVPIHQVWLQPAGLARVARHFSSEGSSYVGVPLLVTAVVVAVVFRRDARVRAIAAVASGAAVLSLGSRLVVAGSPTGLPLPWAALAHLPLLASLLPVRFGVVVDLAAGALLAVGLDAMTRARRHRIVSLGLAVACLGPMIPRLPFRTTHWATPAFFTAHRSVTVADDALVVVSPYPSESDPQVEVWLAAAGDRWRSAGGTYFVPGATGHVTIGGPVPVADAVDVRLEQGVSAAALAPLREQARSDLVERRVAAVIVGPGLHRDEVVRWWSDLLGPPREVAGVELWPLA